MNHERKNELFNRRAKKGVRFRNEEASRRSKHVDNGVLKVFGGFTAVYQQYRVYEQDAVYAAYGKDSWRVRHDC